MPHPAPFMCRRARLIRGLTQEQFADEMDVDPGTVSRWERGKLIPNPGPLSKIRRICHMADPCYSPDYFERAPAYKMMVHTGDLLMPMMVSQGVLDQCGLSREAWMRRAFQGVPNAYDWHRIAKIVLGDKRWNQGAIAFFEAVGQSTITGAWWHIIGAPLSEMNSTLVEGVPNPPCEHKFWVKLYPFDELKHQQDSQSKPERSKVAALHLQSMHRRQSR